MSVLSIVIMSHAYIRLSSICYVYMCIYVWHFFYASHEVTLLVHIIL